MYNVTVIFTRHEEVGNCNSSELHKIIRKINPEIIFEELMSSTYDEIYKEKCLTTLETNAIKSYLQNHEIEHIPADTFDRPKYFDRNTENLFKKMLNKIPESYELKRLLNHQLSLVKQYGFNFLNSDHNDKMVENINHCQEIILKEINDEELFRIASLEKEVREKREDKIIENIVNYSKKHEYNQGLLFIGSGHRSSIIKKVEMSRKQMEINWIYQQ